MLAGPAAAAETEAVAGPAAASVVIAVDVGNSKTDLALVAPDGTLLSALHGPTTSHQRIGAERAFAVLTELAEKAARKAGLDPSTRPLAGLLAYGAAGVDLPADVRLLTRGLRRTAIAAEELVVNDCYIGLRAGTSRSWGVCVICGSGINCLGLAPDGRTARFDALGEISGDWGGGDSLGWAGLAAAVRAEDGRGRPTLLARLVPEHFGVKRPRAVTAAMYRGTVAERRHLEIAELVFEAATQGDAVARGIVNRQADEVVAWATAAIRRLRLQRVGPDVVLAGGVFRAEDAGFYERIDAGIRAVAPGAALRRLTAPPVVGAALLGLDRIHGGQTPADVETRLRAELTHARLSRA